MNKQKPKIDLKKKERNSKRLVKVEYNNSVKEKCTSVIWESKVYSKLRQPLN